jgi:molybdopterin synthase catalytic subunit
MTTPEVPYTHLTREPLDRATLEARVADASDGALVTFAGIVRNHARGRAVEFLEYEAYVEMAEAQIRAILQEAARRWEGSRIAVAHRLGRLAVGDVSVIVTVACPHRAEAFDACRYVIDTLKATVPIWKKEFGPDGAEWVEG